MPTICTFYGITVRMYYDDHNPPHFHAFYGDSAAKLRIDNMDIIAGALPPRALQLLREWAGLNKSLLMKNWLLAVNHERLITIQPLE